MIAVATACVAEGAEPPPQTIAVAVPAARDTPDVKPTPAMPVVDVGDEPLAGAQPSLEAIGRALVDALDDRDADAVLAMTVSSSEYQGRLFGALANHPNAYQMGPELLWRMHSGESSDEMRRAMDRYGGKNLAFESIAIEREETRGGLVFHKRPTIVAKDADGTEYELRVIGTILEHPASGGFKILGFKGAD